MKYLKYFESIEIDYGISSQELSYFFTDLEDLGCSIHIRFSNKFNMPMPKLSTNHDKDYKLNFVLIPCINVEITISKYKIENQMVKKYLENLLISDVFLETIEVASKRLEDYGLFIQSKPFLKLIANPSTFTTEYYIIIDIIKKGS